ncbi:MAG: SPOR domain-containing protein [Treponema sp.]|nr:SPOR domain-containing protein [Treponema sp.]
MKKLIFFVLITIFISVSIYAEATAKFITTEAAKKESVEESVSYLKAQVAKLTVPAEKRAVYIFLASLQEQMALYEDAQKSYAQAAAISSGDAEGMPKRSNEQIVLDAVRCALSSGDYATADSYLNSAVRNSKNTEIQALIKLYTQWSALCRAETSEDLNEPVVMLQAYLKLDNLISIRPQILLTLWYITGDNSYSNQLTKSFPSSIETAIVKGDVQLLPTPFWFFVPKLGVAVAESGSFTSTHSVSEASSEDNSKTAKFTKYQLGLFRTESNAKLLADEVAKKGFESYITTETRASGTTYYIVLVRENAQGNVADRLRSAGYDCYGVD